MSSSSSPPPYFLPSDIALILGTSSSSRRAVLTEGGYSIHEVIKPRIDEKAIGDRSSATRAAELVLMIGHSKADDIIAQILQRENSSSSSISNSISNSNTSTSKDESQVKLKRVILTGDQVVCWMDEILEKPVDETEARTFMKKFHLGPVRTVGSMVLTNVDTLFRCSGIDVVTIIFSEIPDDVIEKMIGEGDVLHCCGALMIEHALIQPYIKSIVGNSSGTGDNMDAIRGISLDHLRILFEQLVSH